MPNIRARMALLAATLCAAAHRADAGQLEVSPVLLEVPGGSSSTVLTVANRGADRTAIQVRGFTWSQGARDDQLAPTRALLISPPIAELDPGETQTVRILLREPARRTEASYRLLIDEIPAAGSPGTVRLSLRLSLPLFAAPAERTAPDLRWQVVNTGGGPELRVVNQGTRRDRVTDLVVNGAGFGSVRAQPLRNPWVLPGAERHWSLPLRGEMRAAQAKVTGKSDTGSVDAILAVQQTP